MQPTVIRTLTVTLSSHLALSKSRIDTLALSIGMVDARTVYSSHLSSQFPGPPVQVLSSDRRLQRFFQYIPLRSDRSAPLAVQLLGLRAPWLLCLDRANWKIGRKDVNILMLAEVARIV